MGPRLNMKSESFTINMYLKKSRPLENVFQRWSYILPQDVESDRTAERKE